MEQEQGQQEFQTVATHQPGEIHSRMMVIVWLVAGNIGLWSQAFKQYRGANYVHLVCMSIVTIITWMSGFMAIIIFGVPGKIGDFHAGLGITIMILLILQSAGGIACMINQKGTKVNPMMVIFSNFSHKIFGFILYILVLIQILAATREEEKGIFIAVIVISLVSYIAFILLKIFRRDMQGYTKLQQLDSGALETISNTRQLAKYNGDYFIFADRVYDINNVIANHPGGYELIKSVKGRQVDRFLYGSEPLQSVQKMKVHSHTSSSISLAGDPIAKWDSTCPYQNMNESNPAMLQSVHNPCRSKILCVPTLTSQSDSGFIYRGYSDLSQLGKYFAVTINNNRTRLYSVVNFLHNSNIGLMNRISGINFEQQTLKLNLMNQMVSSREVVKFQNVDSGIPLLIKRYDKGDFTSKFLQAEFRGNVQISRPRGRGLSLNQVPFGNIIFFAGGTGVNPFCDVIDLLFKQCLVQNGNMNSSFIIQRNPIVSSQVLSKNFKFTLYYSVQNADQIHDLTAYQLNQLSNMGKIRAFIRANQNGQNFFRKYPSISRIDTRFDVVIPQLAQQIDSISQIYLCGPLSMTSSIYKSLVSCNVPSSKYRVL